MDQRGDDGDIKYFSRYALCARGLRDFLAKAGVPYFSFDACHSYHPYYRGMYGNVVALADTKRETLTNCAFALSTDDSEYGGLYDLNMYLESVKAQSCTFLAFSPKS